MMYDKNDLIGQMNLTHWPHLVFFQKQKILTNINNKKKIVGFSIQNFMSNAISMDKPLIF